MFLSHFKTAINAELLLADMEDDITNDRYLKNPVIWKWNLENLEY